MFEFYINNTFEGQNAISWIPIIQILIQALTLFIACTALRTARKSLNTANQNLGTANENLEGVRRTQSVQAHMNLITLQSEVSKNIINRLTATRKLTEFKEGDNMSLLIFEETNAYIQYFPSVDKLASIIQYILFSQTISKQ